MKLIITVLLLGCSATELGSYGTITFTDSHGIGSVNNEFPIDQYEFDTENEFTIQAWERVAEVTGWNIRGIVNPCWVVWRPLPFTDSRYGNYPVAGLYVPHEGVLLVGYTEPLHDTALAHELGHRILCGANAGCNEETLKYYAITYGVPY